MLSNGPVVLGVPWHPDERLIRTGAELASMMGAHLVCAFVDPTSYLTEWEPEALRTAASLDPAPVHETAFPVSAILECLRKILGAPGHAWSFRVLNGDVAQALTRLAESTNASVLIVGGRRPGSLAGMARLLEGSVSLSLIRSQSRPVVVVPRPGS